MSSKYKVNDWNKKSQIVARWATFASRKDILKMKSYFSIKRLVQELSNTHLIWYIFIQSIKYLLQIFLFCFGMIFPTEWWIIFVVTQCLNCVSKTLKEKQKPRTNCVTWNLHQTNCTFCFSPLPLFFFFLIQTQFKWLGLKCLHMVTAGTELDSALRGVE